ncbi:unnamed protein product [Strongylus vulgaris]|uniref:Uncharacterized protein n=1 Tax=Strongylus vulgaris TaxID=40348 RepID=A0A3P7J5J4_STRVU|nr:unnamed protein product [Strongylus vulgaris]
MKELANPVNPTISCAIRKLSIDLEEKAWKVEEMQCKRPAYNNSKASMQTVHYSRMDYFEDEWFEFTAEPILPWWEVALPINMLLSVLILSALLCTLTRENEQIEEEEDIQGYEGIRKVKWHLDEEILVEAKKIFKTENLSSPTQGKVSN